MFGALFETDEFKEVAAFLARKFKFLKMKLLQSFFSQTMYYGFACFSLTLGFLLVPLHIAYFPVENMKVTIFYLQ